MIDQELIEFHDGELALQRADQVRRALNVDPIRRARLEAVRRIDDALIASAVASSPTAEQVERGRAALKAALREHRRTKNRRRFIFALAAIGSMAASVAIIWFTHSNRVVGKVSYGSTHALQFPVTNSDLRLGTRIQTPDAVAASFSLDGVARGTIGPHGCVLIGAAPDKLTLVDGQLQVETHGTLTISLVEETHHVIAEPASVLTILVKDHRALLRQRQGRSRVIEADKETQVVEGKTEKTISLPPR